MPLPNQPFICHVTMYYTRDTRILVNTFHLFKAAGWTLPTMQQAAVDTISWWNGYFKACVPTNVALYQVSIRLYNPANPLAFDQPVSPAYPGTDGTSALPGNVTLSVSWRTGLAGRTQRGRDYVPAINSSRVNSNDTVTSALLSLLQIAAAQFIGPLWSNGVVPAIFHRQTSTYTPINSYVLESILDSQRRRLPGRGR